MAFFGRTKNKIQNPYTMPDMYKDYTVKIEKGTLYDIDYNTYVSIVSMYNKIMIDNLYNGFVMYLPYKLGSFQIVKKKMYFSTQINKKLGIDWVNTVKYGKVIHHLNEHSDGYKFLFHWDKKRNGGIKNINSYRFIPTRTIKRTLAKYVKEFKRDYFEV